MIKKIVVIGANSYIGRNLIYILKQYPEKYELHLYGHQAKQVDGFEPYKSIDVLSKESVKNIVFDSEVIFMLVGRTGSLDGFMDYDSFIDINERGLLNILNEYKNQRSEAKIIFPSTRLVYKGKNEPIKENDEKELRTIYAINKYACEKYIQAYHLAFDVQYCIFRICVPYGELVEDSTSYGTTKLMYSKAMKGENITLYGDGKARRTITYIGDVCETMIEGALSDACLNDIFNIGGEDYSLFEMAKIIGGKFGVGIDYVPWPEKVLRIESGDTVFDSFKLDGRIQFQRRMKLNDWIENS